MLKDLITEAREQIAHLNGAKLAFEKNGFKTAAGIMVNTVAILDRLCDALEKAERESGREWCADNYDHRHKTMFRKGSDWNYEAKYCDMCGKRLEERHETD